MIVAGYNTAIDNNTSCVKFDIARLFVDAVLVLVIVVGAAHVCGMSMRHTGIYRYMRHTQHTHTLFLPAQLLSNHVSKSFERRLLLAIKAPRPDIVSVLISIGVY